MHDQDQRGWSIRDIHGRPVQVATIDQLPGDWPNFAGESGDELRVATVEPLAGGESQLIGPAGEVEPIAMLDWPPAIREQSLRHAMRRLSCWWMTDPSEIVASWQLLPVEIRPSHLPAVVPCRACRAPIVFLEGDRGRPTPVDIAMAAPTDTYFRPRTHRMHRDSCLHRPLAMPPHDA